MSMSVPYTPPDYVAPGAKSTAWNGPERRSLDPVDQLGRSFNRLCLEASDRYEIVAHLEALGFNTPVALERLGVDNHFALAEELYSRTPKSYERPQPRIRDEREWLTPIVMVMALVVTFGLGAHAATLALVAATWVLIWSQGSAALLSKAHDQLGNEEREQVLAILMRAGLVGISVTWGVTRFGIDAAASAFLWYGVAGLLWSRRPRQALVLPLFAAIGLGASAWLGLAAEVVQGATIAAAVGLSAPLFVRDARSVAGWLVRHLRTIVFHLLYGLGQGLLIIGLLRSSPVDADVVPGAILLAAILLSSQALLLALKRRMMLRLWGDWSGQRYVAAAQRFLTVHALAYLVPVGAGLAVQVIFGPQPWMFHWIGFAIFGLTLALAVVSLTLGDAVTPGVALLAAGLVALSGQVLLVCALLAGAQFVLLLRRLARFERYAVYLL